MFSFHFVLLRGDPCAENSTLNPVGLGTVDLPYGYNYIIKSRYLTFMHHHDFQLHNLLITFMKTGHFVHLPLGATPDILICEDELHGNTS